MKKYLRIIAADDAKWDNCFVDLQSIGIRTNTIFTAYDPPEDPNDRLAYDRAWKAARGKK